MPTKKTATKKIPAFIKRAMDAKADAKCKTCKTKKKC